MLLKTLVILVVIVAINSDENVRVKRAKYYSYPSRFYKKPPPPHVIKGPFSYTPPPNYMQDDEPPYRPKVSKKPTNDGLGDEDISNLIKHLTKKDLDKILEFAGENDRYTDKYKDDPSERFEYKPSFRRPERNTGYRNEGVEQFAESIHNFREPDETRPYKVENNDPINYVAAKPRILHPTPSTYSGDFDATSNLNYVNDASQTKVIYTNPPENHIPKITYSSYQELPPQSNPNIPFSTSQGYSSPPFSNQNSQSPFSNNYQQEFANNIPSSNPNSYYSNFQGPLDTEESMRQYNYISYVTIPPNYNINKGNMYTDSDTMKEEQLPRPVNLREDDNEVSNTDNVPKVVKSDAYTVESLKDLPLMNYDSKLHTVSSYNVPHYLVTSTKSQQVYQPSKPSNSAKPLQIEQAPPGYTGKEMSDAHLKAIKIWTHRSKGTAYTLHDDGTLSLEKPKIRTSYGYTP